MQMFYRVEGTGKQAQVGIIRAVSLKHGITKLTALFSYGAGWTSHEVSTKIAEHADELIAAGYATHG